MRKNICTWLLMVAIAVGSATTATAQRLVNGNGASPTRELYASHDHDDDDDDDDDRGRKYRKHHDRYDRHDRYRHDRDRYDRHDRRRDRGCYGRDCRDRRHRHNSYRRPGNVNYGNGYYCPGGYGRLPEMVRRAARGGRNVKVWQVSPDTYVVRYYRGNRCYQQYLYPEGNRYGGVSVNVTAAPPRGWQLIPLVQLNLSF